MFAQFLNWQKVTLDTITQTHLHSHAHALKTRHNDIEFLYDFVYINFVCLFAVIIRKQRSQGITGFSLLFFFRHVLFLGTNGKVPPFQ